MTSTLGLAGASVHVWALLLRTTALGLVFWCLLIPRQGSLTHAALAMASECIVASEGRTTDASMWAIVLVDGGVTLHVVSTNESLEAVVALELAVVEVVLNMRTSVLTTLEPLVTHLARLLLEEAVPLLVRIVLWWVFDVALNNLWWDAGVDDASVDIVTKAVK